jgi:catechol 2,3-dioxygenase-like lactoylglutathione lyase family enzyme
MTSSATTWDAQITFCYTADFESTTHFYEKLLGLPLALDQGNCRIYRVLDGAFIGVCRSDSAPDTDGVILTLVSDDVDGWWARLEERGVRFEKAPAFNPKFNIYHCFLRDPNGYLIEIQRFEDPNWKAREDNGLLH